ncbi:hypothetical protein DR950_13015 [Kitasatospora xanthocidica]|uniref:Uncharacterized protein n=1 Tax=Kitasatospora xanthocidica TaxID=83382 RepID=A0A372ZSZ6_9ACTN|nr:hypothetical protein DR950_13015 [Kitasatospora xanthocidica]
MSLTSSTALCRPVAASTLVTRPRVIAHTEPPSTTRPVTWSSSPAVHRLPPSVSEYASSRPVAVRLGCLPPLMPMSPGFSPGTTNRSPTTTPPNSGRALNSSKACSPPSITSRSYSSPATGITARCRPVRS